MNSALATNLASQHRAELVHAADVWRSTHSEPSRRAKGLMRLLEGLRGGRRHGDPAPASAWLRRAQLSGNY